ncbi:hypothetical protein [Fundidesulfovibrio terrae]|uniref:hypothetical protein n=1 Tax=Fundidesulfovibrio terrae TaxID=2922866 RepID=UPI001FB027FC|nr:hypothetical protein [Fundidesulfovibrio terrae]
MPYPTTAGPAGYAAAGAVDQQAANELRYKRYLEHLAGFAPGESDLPDEEILRRRAMAQGTPQPQAGTGYAPGSAMPQPGQPAPSQVPLQAILASLKARPGMIEHLEGIDVDGDGIPDAPMGPPPMDPMGRMQWQNMMAQRKQMMQAAQQRRAQRKLVNNQAMLAVLQSNDPLFGYVLRRLEGYVRSLPAKVQRPFFEAVERTPGAFLDLYTHLRASVERDLRGTAPISQPMPQPGNADPRARIRQAVAGRMSPPALESAGILDDRLPGATRAAELAALKARCKAGQAREGDLLRYIELSMGDSSPR